MSTKATVIVALNAALEKNPQDQALRLHLSSLLLNEGQATAALDHLRQVLAAKPDDVEALSLAARAARATGQESLAGAYQRMLAALGQKPTTESADSADDDEVLLEFDDSFTEKAAEARVGAVEGSVDTVLDADDEIWDFEQPAFRLAD